MSESISIVVIFNGLEEFLEPALVSVSLQANKCEEVIVADISEGQLLSKGAFKSACENVRIAAKDSAEKISFFLNRIAAECAGVLILFFPAEHILAPTFTESVVSCFSSSTECCAAITQTRVFESVDAILSVDFPEIIAFPDRLCFGLYKKRSFIASGGFHFDDARLMHADLLLRFLSQSTNAVQIVEQHLFLGRYLENRTYISLKRSEISPDRQTFLERHEHLLGCYGASAFMKAESEFERFQGESEQQISQISSRVDLQEKEYSAAAREYADTRAKYLALVQLHNEALSSVRVTFFHLIAALRRKLLLQK